MLASQATAQRSVSPGCCSMPRATCGAIHSTHSSIIAGSRPAVASVVLLPVATRTYAGSLVASHGCVSTVSPANAASLFNAISTTQTEVAICTITPIYGGTPVKSMVLIRAINPVFFLVWRIAVVLIGPVTVVLVRVIELVGPVVVVGSVVV